MYCSRCGKRVLDSMLFCPFCGAPIIIPEQDEPPTPAAPEEAPAEPEIIVPAEPEPVEAAVTPEVLDVPEEEEPATVSTEGTVFQWSVPEAEPEPEPAAEPDPEPIPEPEPEPVPEPEPEPEPEPVPEPEPAPQPEPKPADIPEPEPRRPYTWETPPRKPHHPPRMARPDPERRPRPKPRPEAKPEKALWQDFIEDVPAEPEPVKPEPVKPETVALPAEPEPKKPEPEASEAPLDIFMERSLDPTDDFDAFEAAQERYRMRARTFLSQDRQRSGRDDDLDDMDDLDDLDDLDDDDESFLSRHIRGIVSVVLFVILAALLALYALSEPGQIALAKLDLTLPIKAEIYGKLGYESYQAEDYGRAGAYYERALAREPGSYNYASSAAMAYVNDDNIEKAAELLSRCVEINPGAVEPYIYLMNLYPDIRERPINVARLLEQGYQATGDERLKNE